MTDKQTSKPIDKSALGNVVMEGIKNMINKQLMDNLKDTNKKIK